MAPATMTLDIDVTAIEVPLMDEPEVVPLPYPELAPVRPPAPVATGLQRHYLVVLSNYQDDLPVGLFDDRDDAVRFARLVAHAPDLFGDRALRLMVHPVRSPWLGVGVTEFDGPTPVAHTPLFELPG